MHIIGCDLHARQQTLAVLDTATGQVVETTLMHSSSNVQEFYSTLPGPVRVAIEATGTMPRFLSLMEELGIDCQVGHPAKIRVAEPYGEFEEHIMVDGDRRDGWWATPN
jgi:transposase